LVDAFFLPGVAAGRCIWGLPRVRTDPGKVWKVMEFKVEIFQVWKIMESDLRYGKVLENVTADLFPCPISPFP